MSSIAWILAGLLIVCPHTDAAKPETTCTCQKSGLGPFETSSHSSHHSKHETFGHTGSHTQTSVSNGPFGLGHYVTHAISSAAEAADSALSPFLPSSGSLDSLGNSGSSSHHHVSISYGPSGHSKLLGKLGTKLFGPSETSSWTSESSRPFGSGHYVTYSTSSKTHTAESADKRPFPNEPDGEGPGPLGYEPFGHSGSSSHHHVSITYGQSGNSKSSEQGLKHYTSYNNSEATAQTNPSQFQTNGKESVSSESVLFGQTEPNSHSHETVSVELSGASSNKLGSDLVGLSGSNSMQNGAKLLGQSEESSGTSTNGGSFESGKYVTHTTSSTLQTAEEAGTRPLPNVTDGGGQGISGHSGSLQHVSVTIGQPGQNKLSGSGMGQYAEQNYSISASGSKAAEKKLSTIGGESISSESDLFSHSKPSSDQQTTVSVGISGTVSNQPERGPVGSSETSSVEYGTKLIGPSNESSENSTSSKSFVSGPYLKYTTSHTAQTAEESEQKPSHKGSDGEFLSHSESGTFGHPGSTSHQQMSITFGQLGQNKSSEQYIAHNKTASEIEETKTSQFGKNGVGSISSESVSFKQSEPNPKHQVTASIESSGGGSVQSELKSVEPSEASSDQHIGKLLEPSSTGASSQNESIGSGHHITYTTSSTVQTAEAADTLPSSNKPSGDEPAVFGLSELHQNVSITFPQSGQSQSLKQGLEKNIQDNKSIVTAATDAENTKQHLTGSDVGESQLSVSDIYGQSEPSSDQRVTVSYGQSGASSDQLGHNQIGQSSYSSILNGTGLYGSPEAVSGSFGSSGLLGSGHNLKYETSLLGQTTDKLGYGLSASEANQGEAVSLGNSGSSSNQHVSISFEELGQNKSFGKDQRPYNQFSDSEAAQTELSQFGSNGGEAILTASNAFKQPEQNTYEQVSSSGGQYKISSDQPGREPVRLAGYSTIQNGSRQFESLKSTSGASTPDGFSGSGHNFYGTLSTNQAAEAPETRPSSVGPEMGGPGLFTSGPFGQSGYSSNQHISVNLGQLGQSNSFGEGLGQHNQYSNTATTEENPTQFGQDGEVAVSSGSVSFGLPGVNSYQQISGSIGPYDTSSYLPAHGPVVPSGSNSIKNGFKLSEPSEASGGISTSKGSFGPGNDLKYEASSVGQMAAESETGSSFIGPDTGGPNLFTPGPFGQSVPNSNQHVAITFGQQGQSKSQEDLGQFNQNSYSVTAESKPSQFGLNGGLAASLGSIPFGQPVPNSNQDISGLVGQYATNSNQPDHGPVVSPGSSLGQSGTRLYKPSKSTSEASISTGSNGSGQYLYGTTSVNQAAKEPEIRPLSIGPDTGETSPFTSGSFGQSGSGSDQHISVTLGQFGQSDSFGEGLEQYNQHSNSQVTETKPFQFGSDGGISSSSGSVSFGQPVPNSYQQISGSFGHDHPISDQSGSGSFGTLGFSSNQVGAGLFGLSEANSKPPAKGGSLGYMTHTTSSISQPTEASHASHYPNALDGVKPDLLGPGPFGNSGHSSNQHTAKAPETVPSPIKPYGGGQFELPGYSSHQHVSVTSEQSGQIKPSEQGPGQYIPYGNSIAAEAAEAAETKPYKFEPNGEEKISPESVPFWPREPSLDQQNPSSVGPLTPNLVQPEAGLFKPLETSLGTSASTGTFGSGNYLKYSTSTAAQTSDGGTPPMKADGGALGSSENSGFNSHQHTSVTFGQSGKFYSPEQGLGQYIPTSNSATEVMPVVEQTKLYSYGPYAETLTTSEHRPFRHPENYPNQSGYGPLETSSTSSGLDLHGSGGPHTKNFEPIGSGTYVQYTTSPGSMIEETETKPTSFVKIEEGPGPTGFTAYRPSEQLYTPISVPFSTYGPSADHSQAESIGLSSISLGQPTTGPQLTSQQSKESYGTSGILGQGSYVPYTISTEAEVGTTGQPKPGLFGLSGSNSVMSVQNGPLGPGLYIPYRNAKGAAVAATSQIEPSPYEPHIGAADSSQSISVQPALGYIGPSTSISYESSTGQSNVAVEPNGSEVHNSLSPPETTTVVTVSPLNKKAVLKSASRLSSLLTTSRVSTAISFLLDSGRFNPSSLSKVISYLIKSIYEYQPSVSGDEMLLQVLLEMIVSLVHILLSASIGQVGNCPSSSSSLVGQSITHAIGS